MRRQSLFINSVFSIGQALLLAIIPLILYRYLLEVLGADQLGLWSLILSTTSMSRIGELGLSASAVKFVAKYVALEHLETASEVIQTATISIFLLVLLLVIVAYPIASLVLRFALPEASIASALEILPIALLSLLLLAISGVLQSGIDGYQRVDIRSYITVGGTILYFVLSIFAAPRLGLLGLAYAQLIQSLCTTVASWLILRRIFPRLPVFPSVWSYPLFREMLGYGINFQAASFLNLLYEPMTMALLSRFSTLSSVAYYQMAKKLVTQLRALILAGNRAIVPFVAERVEQNPQAVQRMYVNSQRTLTYIAIPSFALLTSLAPLFSVLLIGETQQAFILFSMILSIGWFLNTISAPAYFMYMGLGDLRWNTITHVLTALVNLVAGALLGSQFGGVGVVSAWSFSLGISAVVLLTSYLLEYAVPWRDLHLSYDAILAATSVLGSAISLVVPRVLLPSASILVQVFLTLLIFSGIVALPLWLHPTRRRLQSWILANYLQMNRSAVQ